ncbi:TatD family hydrolase [Archaeoglobus sulfaticallidus]|nr:TatD family hydrolase [Archaeoglobus sulfaticallidus]
MDNLVDSHTHAYMLPKKDLELMGLAKIVDVVLCSFVPLAKHIETLIDHFEELYSIHCKRLEEFGINAHIFVGIHPRCTPPEWKKLLPVIENYIESSKAVGIGEVGLDSMSKTEEEVLSEQLKIAREYDVPVIVHIPMVERIKAVEKVISIAKSIEMDFGKLVIDHTSSDTIDYVNDSNAVPGLSVKPPLLDPAKIVENIDKYCGGVLNSDCATLTDTDPLAVPKTVKYLEIKGIEKSIIEKLASLNTRKVFRIK